MGHGLVWRKPLPRTTPPHALLSTLGSKGPAHPRLQMAMGRKQDLDLLGQREKTHRPIPYAIGWQVSYDQPIPIPWGGGNPTVFKSC